MKNYTSLNKLKYTTLATLAYANTSFAAGLDGGLNRISDDVRGNDETLDVAIQQYVSNFLGFLALLGVIYGIYGGFLILTAGGDDSKVKKGKTILFQAVLGIIVIFLAYSIVSFILTMIVGGGTQ